MTAGHLTELPSEAIHPVGDVHPPKIVDLPPAALQPLPEPSRASRGLVIAFPPNGDRSRRGGAQPAVAPLELDPPRPLPPGLARPLNVPPPPAAFPWRWVVYGALILAVTLITGGTVWYVRSLASWTAPDQTPEPVADAVSAPPIVRSPGAPEMVDSEDLTALLKELRGRLSLETVESDPDGEGLADALFIELRRLISVKDTHVQVLRMTQTRRPEPLTVEVRVWVNTQGDVYRELGAVGLVVGKMLYQLSLEAPVVEAILVSEDGTTRKRAIRGEAALALYRGEMDLRSFLVDAPPEPGAGTQSP